MLEKITEYRKALAAAAGSVLLIWNEVSPSLSGFFPEGWTHWVTVVVGVLTVVATWGVPNKPAA